MPTSPGKRLPPATELRFRNLTTDNYEVTSPKDSSYNCVAWAVGLSNVLLWPDSPGYEWPSEVAESQEAFIEFFKQYQFERCDDWSLQTGFEKVAIYVEEGEVTHVARQLPSGHWTSKLGFDLQDIEHHTLDGIEKQCYGQAAIYMGRPLLDS